MKKFFFFFLLFFMNALSVSAYNSSTIVVEASSGRILYQDNINQKKLIASTTKIMTCIIVLENVKLDQMVTVGNEVSTMYGTSIYLKEGEKLSVKDLLYGLMLRSGNDAAITLAVQTLGESNFIEKMNEKAQELHMDNTIFCNPHGLDEVTRNYSTAYDMSLLAQYAYKNKEFLKIISTKKYYAQSSLKSYIWTNRMSLIYDYNYCIGGKNGYTPLAGKTLVSYARRGNMVLIIVSLNDSQIYDNHKKLYNQFFKRYQNYTIVDKKTFSISYTFTQKKLYIKNSFVYPLQEDEIGSIGTYVEFYNHNNEKKVGTIRIQLDKKQIGEVPIYQYEVEKKEDQNIFFQWIHFLFDNLKKLIDGLQKSLIPFSDPKPLEIYSSESCTL